MPAIATDTNRLRPLALIAAFVVILLAGTTVLWAYYGTTVFFEMLRAGWAACF